MCVIVEVLLIIHTSLYLFYFSCRKEGDIPLGVVNILAYCDPTYEEVNNYRPSLPLPSATEVVGVNLESCPAYVSATEGVGGVNLKHEYEDTDFCRTPSPLTATEEVGGVNLKHEYEDTDFCQTPSPLTATEVVGGVNLKHEYEDTDFCRTPSPLTATEEVGDYLEICPANMSATEEVGATCGSLPGADSDRYLSMD